VTTADATTIRNWALSNGFTTSARGPLSAKVVAAYAAAHVGPASMPSVKAVAKKPSAAKKNATTRRVAPTTAPDKKAPAKKPATKKTTSVPAREVSAAAPASSNYSAGFGAVPLEGEGRR